MRSPRLAGILWTLLASASACASSPPEDDSTQPRTGVVSVDHVGLAVSDVQASRALFIRALDFDELQALPDGAGYVLTNGAVFLSLWAVEHDANAFDHHRNVGLHHLALGVADATTLQAFYERLQVYPGVQIEDEPGPWQGGPSRNMMFREPSGNRIELIHRVGP